LSFIFKSRDKEAAIDRAAYIAKNFEPNSNYDLDIMVRRDREDREQWTVSARLIFPHMHYKRKVVQQDLARGLKYRVLPSRRVTGRSVGHMIKRYLSLIDEYQATLSRWTAT
jgi:hypothetical protein